MDFLNIRRCTRLDIVVGGRIWSADEIEDIRDKS